jgi:cell division transport system ATP-binding protein
MRATGWTDKKLIADRTLDVLEKVGLRSKLKKCRMNYLAASSNVW